jgi:glycosyltransferase involved in cell wall biosynthesis
VTRGASGIGHVVLSLGRGGTERLVIELSRRMRPLVRVVICLDAPGDWAGEVTNEGVPVMALHRRPGFRPLLAVSIARIAAMHGVDVLHCHHYSPFVYGRLATALRPHLRLVFTEHGRLSDAPPSSKRRLLNPMLSRFGGSIHAVSYDLKAHMEAEGFPPQRVGVIHNGIDPGPPVTGEHRLQARTALGLRSDDLALGTVARLDVVKDLGTLLRTVASLLRAWPSLQFLLVGDGPERRSLELLADELGLGRAVRFLGERDDVRTLLPAFDIYVNSSVSEGISLTLLEAMAAGRPVVATAVGGTPEVVEHGHTGFLAPARSPDALNRCIEPLLHSIGLRNEFGSAGRSRVERNFSLARMIADYQRVYEAVAS